MLAADREALRVSPDRSEEYVPATEPVATWWRQLSPGTYYWRCKVPAKAVGGQVLMFEKDDVVDDDGPFDAVFPRQKGAAIWPFAGNTTRGILMAAMKEQGHRTLMEADDNYVIGVDPAVRGQDWKDTIAEAEGAHSYEAHTKLCKWVDGIIVSTENLASHYRKLNPNVYVCPNSIDPDDWEEPEKPDDGILRIGWAASHSHLLDVPLVKSAFRWAADQPNVEVLVYGIGGVASFPGRVKKVGWTDNLADYRRSLSRCDIHVCPLIESPWSAGKSDLKAMEAAMAGAWPIVSSATPYKPWHNLNYITCTTKKDWTDALKWAVRHRDKIPELAAEAKAYVMSERLISQSKHLWEEAIG